MGPWPLAPHHDHLQYVHHHIHLMQRGQNRGVTPTYSTLDYTCKQVKRYGWSVREGED